MSLRATLWALDDAPTDDPYEALVLIALADHADDDGREGQQRRGTREAPGRDHVRADPDSRLGDRRRDGGRARRGHPGHGAQR